MRDISFLCDVLLCCGGLDLAGSRMTTRVDTVVNCFSAVGFSKIIKLRFSLSLRYQGLHCLRIKVSIRRRKDIRTQM